MDLKKRALIFSLCLNFTEEKLRLSYQHGWKHDTEVTSQTPSNPAPVWGFAQPWTPLSSPRACFLLWLAPTQQEPFHSKPLQPSYPPLSLAGEKTSCDLASGSCKALVGGSCLCCSLGSTGDAAPGVGGQHRGSPPSPTQAPAPHGMRLQIGAEGRRVNLRQPKKPQISANANKSLGIIRKMYGCHSNCQAWLWGCFTPSSGAEQLEVGMEAKPCAVPQEATETGKGSARQGQLHHHRPYGVWGC